MHLEKLKSLYEKNKLSNYDHAVQFLTEVNHFLNQTYLIDMDETKTKEIDELVHYLVLTNQNTIENFMILMRYFKALDLHDHFIHLTKYTGSYGVVTSILNKLAKVCDQNVTKIILDQTEIPVLGTSFEEITSFTEKFMELLENELDEEKLKRVLADNHHQIPKEAFLKEQIYYEHAATLKDYLKDLHKRKVKELESFYEQNRVWYEQQITPEVIDYVKSNQEIMSAVLEGDYLYITKIPYDTMRYLQAVDPYDQAYYLCHCPFARESMKLKNVQISKNWCYCSGGFTKYQFDVLFNRELKIELLFSALNLDGSCRFKIDLAGVDYKK